MCFNALLVSFSFIVINYTFMQFLLNDELDVASIYLFIILSWSKYVGVDLSGYPSLNAFSERVSAVPAVGQAMGEMHA